MKKLICFDVDGTLINYEGETYIPKGTVEALKKLKQNGHITAIATGRDYNLVKPLMKKLNIDCAIAHNGAHIVIGDKSVYEKKFGKRISRNILYELVKHDFCLFAFDGDYCYVNKMTEGIKDYIEIESGRDDMIKPVSDFTSDFFHASIYGDMEKVIDFINRQKTVYFNPDPPELLPIGVTKGTAVKRLARLLGIPKKDVIAVGDGNNDVEMIKYAKIGIAVGNACDELKEVADIVCDDIDNDGIYKVFKTLKLI